MRLIIVGGGKLGYYLSATMLDRDHEVKLIEKDERRCLVLANLLDAEVICGDGTDIELLASCGTGKADCFISVSGSDQVNLVSSQLAKRRFMVKKVITRANNPKNLQALRKLGFGVTVSSTEIITNLIEQEVELESMKLIASLNKGKASICTCIIGEKSKIAGMALKDINMPKSSLIISLFRQERFIIPQGDTVIEVGDEVAAVCDETNRRQLTKLLNASY